MINRHLLVYGNDPGLREGHEVRRWRTWAAQRPGWPVFVVSHWMGYSFFDLLHAFLRLSYANPPDRPEEETRWSWVEEDKDLLSYSLPPFHAISPLFLPLPLSSNLTDFGLKGSECLVDEKGGDAILTVTHTTCEDQVCCRDPELCVRGVLSGVALVVCIDIR